MDAYKKLEEVVLASTKDSPSMLLFPFAEAGGCTVLQDQTKQVAISKSNKNCFLEVYIQND